MLKDNLYSKTKVELIQIVRRLNACVDAHERFNLADTSEIIFNDDKECIIENAQFSYILKVDYKDIPFHGGNSIDYFEKHYKELGYKVRFTKTLKE